MEFNVEPEFGLRLLISFIVGTAIGFEREYHSKAAGLRTMLMICFGSTIFTILSFSIMGDSKDRIASNIVTGVGFLGAGVIFKDGLTVTGLTTASTIWISAALGMAIGLGEYFVALTGSGIVIIVLSVLDRFQRLIEKMHQVRTYKINVEVDTSFLPGLEKEVARRKLKMRKKRDLKQPKTLLLVYDISGTESELDNFNEYLKKQKSVLSYEY